jgi:IclR family pca regulon transcriptional regulator
MGKVQLIDLSPEEIRDLLGDGPYQKRGPNTITTLEGLLKELEQVRRQGYAINDEELESGLRSVAAAVRDHAGLIAAAINVSVPTIRVSRQELDEELAPMVIETSHQISSALGARDYR